MEWQPTFGFSAQQVSLIQLAVSDQVFLLDLCANEFCHHPQTISFIRSLLSRRNVLKLGKPWPWQGGNSNPKAFQFVALSLTSHLSPHAGYGLSGDMKCVLATWQQFVEEPLKMEGMLDLFNVHQKVKCPALNVTSYQWFWVGFFIFILESLAYGNLA